MTAIHISRVSELDSEKARFALQGIRGTAIAGQTTTIDWKFPQERWIEGARVILQGHHIDDVAHIQIVDVDGVVSAAGTVIATNGSDLCVDPSMGTQGEQRSSYVRLIPANVYFRIVYQSAGPTDVKVRVNLFTHIPLG